MARYKLPRLQKNSGSFSALPVSLHRRAWFTSALPFAAPVQPFHCASPALHRFIAVPVHGCSGFVAAPWYGFWRGLGVFGAYVG